MAVGRFRRHRKGAKRLDLSDIRHVLRDRRQWAGLGLVIDPDGDGHFEIVTEGGGIAEILVEVELVPERTPLTCRLAGSAGGNRGLWQVPDEGDEVIVIIPDGDIAFMPSIVGVLSSGRIPDGVNQTTTVIVDGEVQVHDGSGGVEPVVRKSEYDSLKTALDTHVHPAGALLDSTASPVTGITASVTVPFPGASGTAVLKAK